MGRYQNHRLYPVGPKVRRIKIAPDGRIALGARDGRGLSRSLQFVVCWTRRACTDPQHLAIRANSLKFYVWAIVL